MKQTRCNISILTLRDLSPPCLYSGPLRGSTAVKAIIWLMQYQVTNECDPVLTGPCIIEGTPCPCFLIPSGALCEFSHTVACLDIYGRQIEMQVLIETIDAFLLVTHELGGGWRHTTGCACISFLHSNIHFLWHSGKPVVVKAYGCQSTLGDKVKGSCKFRSCCGPGRGMQCFPESQRGECKSCDVGWLRGSVHSTITRQQCRRAVRWTCLCYALFHAVETICSMENHNVSKCVV